MLNLHSIKEEASTSIEKEDIKLKKTELRFTDEFYDFFKKIDPSMNVSLVFKREIVNATAEYQSELKDLLKAAKQEKITKFSKPMPLA